MEAPSTPVRRQLAADAAGVLDGDDLARAGPAWDEATPVACSVASSEHAGFSPPAGGSVGTAVRTGCEGGDGPASPRQPHTTGPWHMPIPWLEGSASGSSVPSRQEDVAQATVCSPEALPQWREPLAESRRTDPPPRGAGATCCCRRCRRWAVISRAVCTRHALLTYRLHPCYITWYAIFAAATVLPLIRDCYFGCSGDLADWETTLEVIIGLGLSAETLVTLWLLGAERFLRETACILDLLVAVLALASAAYSIVGQVSSTGGSVSAGLQLGFEVVRMVLLPLRALLVCFGIMRARKFQEEGMGLQVDFNSPPFHNVAHRTSLSRSNTRDAQGRSTFTHPVRTPFVLFAALTPPSSTCSLNSRADGS